MAPAVHIVPVSKLQEDEADEQTLESEVRLGKCRGGACALMLMHRAFWKEMSFSRPSIARRSADARGLRVCKRSLREAVLEGWFQSTSCDAWAGSGRQCRAMGARHETNNLRTNWPAPSRLPLSRDGALAILMAQY